MIKLEDVTKIYPTKDLDVIAVENVQMEVEKGDIYGIIGFSGAGKSTLIRLLNGLEKPTNGKIWIGDRELTKLSGKQLRVERQKIGMIFQHFHLLWSRTVLENILFPLEIAGIPKAEREEKAQHLIELVGLKGREQSYPAQLSGGQKQRVGIARALANDPDILLCDEATSALDPQTTDQILDLLVDINKRLGLTIVLITHEMGVVRKICNKVAVMEEGRIVEEGDVIEVFKYPQQNITKTFVRQDQQPDDKQTSVVLKKIKEDFPKGKIVQLTFTEQTAQQPIISTISRHRNVDLNIVYGNIQATKENSLGSLVVQLIGAPDDVEKTLEDLRVANIGLSEIDAGDSYE